MLITSPAGKEFNACFRNEILMYIASRTDLDNMLREKAIEAGAIFHQLKVKEAVIDNGKVIGIRTERDEILEAQVVVVADGQVEV